MSLINFASLGGVSETGKNLYVLEIDKDIYILDCGIKYPNQEMYGIDLVLPDFSYVINNASSVKGIFLSHAHDDHIGALAYLLKYVNVPVYATPFTIKVVKSTLTEHEMNASLYNLRTVEYNEDIKFGRTTVKFIQSAHSIPGSAFINFKTQDGNILYTGNYNFAPSDNPLYRTDYDSLMKLKEQGVLILLQEAISTTSSINRSLNKSFLYKFEKELKNAKGRTIVSLFSTNLARIEEILKICVKNKKRISIIGRKTQRIVSIALENKLIDVDENSIVNLKYMTDTSRNNDKDLVCLVCGERHEPYFMLQRMCRGVDRLINIESEDTIMVLTKPHIGIEKMAAKTLDMVYRKTDNVVTFSNDLLLSSSSSEEEAKQLLDMLEPKYIIPVIGDYRQLVNIKKIAKELGQQDEDIIIPEPGSFYRFYEKSYMGVIETIPLNDILIEGKGMQDISDQVLKDRLLLASSGVIMFIVNVSAKERKVLSKPVVISKGFYIDKNDEKKMLELFDMVTENIFKEKFIVWSTYKSELKSAITKYLIDKTKSDPLVIPVIISTEK